MPQDRFAPVYSQDWDVRVRAIEGYLSNLASLPASVASAMQTGDFSGLVSSSTSSSSPGLVFDSLLDVTITTPASGDLPVYSSAGWVNQQWTPGKLGVGTTLTPTHRFELEDGNYTAWFDGQNSNPLSGARGWHISKVKTVALPHTITWHVDGHSSWEIGMDFDTNNALSSGFGNADFVVAYDPTAGKNDAGVGAGTGADIFRFSPAEASVAGDNYGRVGLGFRQGSPNTAGSAWFTVTGPPDVVGLNVSTNSTFSYGLKMVQRGAHNRALLNHNDKFAIGTDYAAANAQNYQLRDLVAGVTRWFVDSAGRHQIGGTSPTGQLHVTRAAVAANPTSPTYLKVEAVADTAMTAGTEVVDVLFDCSRTLQFSTGAITAQRAWKLLAPTYGFVAASTVTDAATLYVDRQPQAGTNATLTSSWAIWVDDGPSRFDGPVQAFNFANAVANKTANYTLTASDGTVTGDTTGGGFTLTLPTAVGIAGRIYYVKNTGSPANNLTIATTGGQTIDGAATQVISATNASLSVQSNGSNWILV
jgi:hypothetical protein